jgi:CheY-like chemotaxis protein
LPCGRDRSQYFRRREGLVADRVLREMECREVLLVDDDEFLREAFSELIGARGYTVATFANGRDALDYVVTKTSEVGLVFLDLHMPVFDGWSFLAQRKAAALDHVPVVVLSAVPDARASVEQQVDAVFEKPIKADVMLELVQKYCGRPAAARNWFLPPRFRPARS